LRKSLDAKTVTMADFEAALGDSRASVTPEMERDYEQIAATIKQDAAALQPIGFIAPGQLRPHGPKGTD
jgi:transitional endoplasmic reticulum ATPase